MTPVEQVQEWLTAIGETTYDAEHREWLMWEELRELQAAMDGWHRTRGFLKTGKGRVNDIAEQAKLDTIAVARELCDLAYVAIGTAILQPDRVGNVVWPLGFEPIEQKRSDVEAGLYLLFRYPNSLRPILRASTFYGFGDKLEACFTEVHAANMRKLDCGCATETLRRIGRNCLTCNTTGRVVLRSADGRILKPANWQPPNLQPILFGEAR